MEIWLIVLISLCICCLLNSIFAQFRSSTNLPPSPFLWASVPIITIFLRLRKSPLQFESLLRSFAAKYGPIITIHFNNHPAIFIADRFVAHKALLQNGVLFANRAPRPPTTKILSSNQPNISSENYGPLWRLLRRNLTSQILHPSRVKSYARARKWVLNILLNRLLSHSESGTPVSVADHFQHTMFCLLVFMCFGDRLDETKIMEILNLQRQILVNLGRSQVLNFLPKLTKLFLRKRWEILFELRRNQEKVLIPLIEARRKANQNRANRSEGQEDDEEFVVSYVDTLLDLELPDENRMLTDDEMVTISFEFLNAGSDNTSTALQWIMANIVKYPEIQNKLFAEIKGVKGEESGEEEVKEEDLGKLPYLKAVVLEGLRRHPPVHFLLPHAVKEDTVSENYVIPKNGTVNFMVAEMGWDPKVWEDPMAFKPERFMKGGNCKEEEVAFDITGSKEIKMMPFGAGRRMCPGFGLAILHLEYFVANLVWRFEWKALDGDEVDLSEKVEFTVAMEKPLQANIHPR